MPITGPMILTKRISYSGITEKAIEQAARGRTYGKATNRQTTAAIPAITDTASLTV